MPNLLVVGVPATGKPDKAVFSTSHTRLHRAAEAGQPVTAEGTEHANKVQHQRSTTTLVTNPGASTQPGYSSSQKGATWGMGLPGHCPSLGRISCSTGDSLPTPLRTSRSGQRAPR